MSTALLARRAPLRAVAVTLPLLAGCCLAAAILASSALAAPPVSATPSAHDFGIQHVDWGQQQTNVTIQNITPDPVMMGSSWIDGPGGSAYWVGWDGCNGQWLGGGQTCNVQVSFDPGAPQPYDATLHVKADSSEATVALTGTGGKPLPVAAPAALTFGTAAVGAATTRTVAVTNEGNLPARTIVALPMGGDVGAFAIDRDGCSLKELQPGTACTLTVRFAPRSAGPADATLALIGDGDQPLQAPLSGVGEALIVPAAASGSGAVPAAAAVSPAPLPAGGSPSWPAGPAATAAAGSTTPVGAGTARVAFAGRAGLPAPVAGGRADLGVARCVGAARCTVTVRAWVHAVSPTGSRTATRVRTVVWRPGDGRRVSLPLPAAARTSASGARVLVAVLTTTAPGRAAGVRTLVTRLVAAS